MALKEITCQHCGCISYNRPEADQTRPEVILMPPFQDKTVCIDACIAEAIETLWDNGIVTRGSCCGHGQIDRPSVVLGEGTTDDDARRVHDILRECDGRQWDVLAWRLVSVPQIELCQKCGWPRADCGCDNP